MPKIHGWFTFTGAVLLFVMAGPILLAARDEMNVLSLDVRDPLFSLKYRQILYVLGGLELALSALLLLTRSGNIKLLVTAWLTTILLTYQGVLWHGKEASIGCLANLTNKLLVSPKVYDRVMFVSLVWLLSGSVLLLVLDWWANRKRTSLIQPAIPGEQKIGVALGQ